MARLILDSDVLIAAERGGSSLEGLINDADDVAIAAITAAELLVGGHLADPAHRRKRNAFVQSILDTVPIEDYDLSVARAHADLLAHSRRQGRPRGAHDLVIAATAVARERIIVSGDLTAYADLPGVLVRT